MMTLQKREEKYFYRQQRKKKIAVFLENKVETRTYYINDLS